MSKFAFATALAICASVVVADFPLYIPGFDPQPLSASIQGVDAQGRTTYLIGPGTTSADEDPSGLRVSATLVEGPSEAHLHYVDTLVSVSLTEDCSINNGLAVCTVTASGEGTSQMFVTTDTVTPITVQGDTAGFTSTPAAGSSPTGGPAPTTSQTGSSAGSTPAAPTGGANGDDNGAGSRAETRMSIVLSLGVVGLISTYFF